MPPDPHGGPTTPFDRRAYSRFALPRSMASAMAGLDEPEPTPGEYAHHMRPDDLVIGLTLRTGDGLEHARAYPIWIVDHYHVVNDELGGMRVVVTSCERCQTGSAFLAAPPGPEDRAPLFRAGGVFCATLMMSDLRSGSIWRHSDGHAVRGRAATQGARLPWLPTLVIEWDEWRGLHPDTDVIVAPVDPRHPDARHGHGREEVFCRPGIDPAFLPTIVGPLDERFPEHELVLGVDLEEPRAYPLREVQRAGGVVHDDGLVVLAGPGPAGSAMRAFSASDTLGRLMRDVRTGAFRDDVSSSTWTIEGLAVDGPLAGTRLEPVRSYLMRWHAWVYSRRTTSLYLCAEPEPSADRDIDLGDLDTVVRAWRAAGIDVQVQVQAPVPRQRRPRATTTSVQATIDGTPVLIHRFEHLAAARDQEAFEGAWACDPFAARVLPRRSVRVGAVVVQSDAWPRFVDPAQLVPVPESELPWPEVLDRLGELTPPGLLDTEEGPPAFIDVLRALRSSGHEVLDPGFLPPAQLLPGCLDAIAATIEGDRFLWYRFADAERAGAASSSMPTGHAVAAGAFVARSTPDTMYRHRVYEIDYAGDDVIRWSTLIDDERFLHTMRAACDPAAAPDPPEEDPA